MTKEQFSFAQIRHDAILSNISEMFDTLRLTEPEKIQCAALAKKLSEAVDEIAKTKKSLLTSLPNGPIFFAFRDTIVKLVRERGLIFANSRIEFLASHLYEVSVQEGDAVGRNESWNAATVRRKISS